MSTQAELAQALREAVASLHKTATEISGVQAQVDELKLKVDALQAIIDAGGSVSPELQDAVNAVVEQTKAVDDQIPDAPAVPEAFG